MVNLKQLIISFNPRLQIAFKVLTLRTLMLVEKQHNFFTEFNKIREYEISNDQYTQLIRHVKLLLKNF